MYTTADIAPLGRKTALGSRIRYYFALLCAVGFAKRFTGGVLDKKRR